MAIKIRKDGVVQDLVINANEVRVLDKDGNFRSKNLETVLKELNMNGGSGGGTGTGGSGYPKDAEYVYVKDSEPDMDGVWFDESDVSSQPIVGDNSVVKAIREYIDTDVKDTVVKNDKIVQDIKENVGDKLDVVSELAKPNLIVNGGFSVWQKSKSMIMKSTGFCADNIHLGYVNSTHIAIVSKQDYGILTEFDSWATKRTLEYYVLIPSDIIRPLRKKKVTISCQLDMEHSVLFKTMNKHISAFFSTDDETTCGIGCTVNRIEDANVYQAFDIEETNGFMAITIDIPENASALSLRFGVGLGNITDEELAQITTCKLAYNYFKLEVGEQATPNLLKPYYEELLACNDGIIGSNPNILINGGFDVWQRGTSFLHTHTQYCADRWQMFMTNADGKITWSKTNDGIKALCTVANTNGHARIWYTMDSSDRTNLLGKTLTYTIRYRTNSERVCLMTNNSYLSLEKSTDWKVFSHTESYNASNQWFTGVQFGDNNYSMALNEYIEIAYIKAEVGEYSTPFVAKSYAEELRDCARYYAIAQIPQTVVTCETNQIVTVVNVPVPMRVSPTITLTHDCYFQKVSGGSPILLRSLGDKLSVSEWKENSTNYLVWIWNSSDAPSGLATSTTGVINCSGSANNRLSGATWMTLDAEIY